MAALTNVKAEPFTIIMDASLQWECKGERHLRKAHLKTGLLLCPYADYLIHEVKYLRGNN